MFIQSNQTNKGVNTQYLCFSLLKISSISTYFFIINLSIMQTVYFANCDISDIFLLCPHSASWIFQWMILIDDFIFFSFHFHNLCILIDEKTEWYGMKLNWWAHDQWWRLQLHMKPNSIRSTFFFWLNSFLIAFQFCHFNLGFISAYAHPHFD